MPQSAPTCFISYARLDEERVRPLVRLIEASGTRAFRDVDDLEYGLDWEVQLCKAIEDAGLVLVFWSEHAAKADGVAAELRHAMSLPDCRIVPIMLDDTPMPDGLARRHGVPFQAVAGIPDATAAAKKIKEIWDGDFPRVESELMEARTLLRAFNAVANCDPERWFGGSKMAHSLAYYGTVNRILLILWRVTDPANPNSVVSTLRTAGAHDLANQITDAREVRFVRHYVQHKTISSADSELEETSDHVDGQPAGSLRFDIVAKALDVCCKAYMKHRGQGDRYLDPYRQYREPFEDTYREAGIPTVDFEPADIFNPHR